MPLPPTIHSAVSPDAIRRASRLFSGDSRDCLHEMFQNARRAGATCIAVDLTEQDGRYHLHIRDDGCGIDDPAALLMLGHSGWGDDIARSEDPAGMGMFSLAGRTVEIQSFSPSAGTAWKVQIPADAWDSGAPLAIAPAMIGWGTLISIELPPDWKQGLSAVVADAARHYPLPVTLNETLLPREDFLKDAMFVENACGCRIGAYDRDPDWPRDQRINFHGHRVKCALPTVREEKDSGSLWTVRIDIMDAPAYGSAGAQGGYRQRGIERASRRCRADPVQGHRDPAGPSAALYRLAAGVRAGRHAAAGALRAGDLAAADRRRLSWAKQPHDRS